MAEVVIEAVGAYENPILCTNIAQVLFSQRVLFYFSKRIGYMQFVTAFKNVITQHQERPVKGKLILSGQEDEIFGLGRDLIFQAIQNISKLTQLGPSIL